MKKLTKTQKNNLKKKVLRTANIIGLIVGGLSFLVVLYAIIAGSLNDNAPAEVVEDVPQRPMLEQRALTPPTSYDLELSALPVGAQPEYYFYWQTPNSSVHTEPLFTPYTDTIDYYRNDHYFFGLQITTQVYSPTTNIQSRGDPLDDLWAFRGQYFGSDDFISSAHPRFRIILDNRMSKNAFLFYADFSSSSTNVSGDIYSFDENNNILGNSSPFNSFAGNVLRSYYIPPYSRVRFDLGYTTIHSVYLDALYIQNLGDYIWAQANDEGFENGYTTGVHDGYNEGYADGLDVGFDMYDNGYVEGYDVGYDVGYDDGVGATTASTNAVANAFDLIYSGAESVDRILSISVFGSITLGMLLFTPLIVGISLAVIKVIKG